MASTCFDVETKDKIAHVRLNRPDELNTMIGNREQQVAAGGQGKPRTLGVVGRKR